MEDEESINNNNDVTNNDNNYNVNSRRNRNQDLSLLDGSYWTLVHLFPVLRHAIVQFIPQQRQPKIKLKTKTKTPRSKIGT